MNRRSFLTRMGAAVGALFTAPLVACKLNTELEDLYSYVESQEIYSFIEGYIPFKLYPFQKDILRLIHENERLVIVQGRQIGMTNLAAVYAAWASHRKNQRPDIKSFRYEMKQEFIRKYDQFNGRRGRPAGRTIYFYDNANYKPGGLHSAFFDSRFDKTIVYGTPDPQKVLKKFVSENSDMHEPFKVVHYPLWKCKGLWTPERIHNISDALGIEETHAIL